MNKKLVVAGVLTALTVGTGAWVAVQRGQAASITVDSGPIRETIIAQGKVVAIAGTAEVRALVDGRVVDVAVREGDVIKAGQLLARIDTAELDATIARAEAERGVATAELRLAQAGGRREDRRAAQAALAAARETLSLEESRAARDTELAGKGAVAEATADESRRGAEIARARVARAEAERNGTLSGRVEQVDAAKSRVAAADAELAAAKARLTRAVVVAPISGVVLARHVDAGDGVVPGTAMFEIADSAATELQLEIEELDALRVSAGLTVTVTTPGGREVISHGTIDRLSPRLDRRTIGASEARMRAEAQVRSVWAKWSDDAGTALPIGMRVEAKVELPARDVATRLPRNAVKVRDGAATVEVPHYGLFADERPVEVGAADAQWVEVRGVRKGTRVIGRMP